ncbi:MAG TPA: hypothetical protein VIY52_34650 [Streptosporangiaceae bacterium]
MTSPHDRTARLREAVVPGWLAEAVPDWLTEAVRSKPRRLGASSRCDRTGVGWGMCREPVFAGTGTMI